MMNLADKFRNTMVTLGPEEGQSLYNDRIKLITENADGNWLIVFDDYSFIIAGPQGYQIDMLMDVGPNGLLQVMALFPEFAKTLGPVKKLLEGLAK